MEFNSDKCEVLRITRKRNPVIFPYKLHNKELNVTNAAKYLCVSISKDLNWTPHINNITGKARNTLRFIKRNIKTSNTKVKEMAYNTYVRPQVEYCSTIWNPWQKTLSQKIESVQGSAARYVCNNYNYTNSVTPMLKSLIWHTLEYRRNQSSLMYFYKIRNVLVHVDHHHLIPTRNLNYLIPHSNTQYHSNSYFPRTIRLWNSLPGTVQASPSLAIFATRLAAVPFKYQYKH